MNLAVSLWFATALLAQNVTVSGTVTHAITHEPIAGVKLIIFGSDDAHESSTDASGAFRVQGVQGCCRILFYKEGYDIVGPSRLQFHATSDPAPLSVAMLPWPTVRGRVFDGDQQPIGGSTVQAISMSSEGKPVTAGTDGGFTLQTPPGDYVLYAIPASARSDGSTELAPTYFPDKTERSQAQRVRLKAGDDLSGFDIVLRRVTIFRVSGRVVDERGASAAGATLQLSTARTKISADSDGKFELARVRPGNDMLQADWQHGDNALRGFAPVMVSDHDIENVTVRVTPPVDVSGTIELDGRPAQVQGNGWLEPVDGNGTAARGSIGPSGIHFPCVYPGRYRIDVQVNSAFSHPMYLDSVRLDERDITVEEFEVMPGILPIHVVLKTGGGRVRGTVKDGTGGIVVLVPQDERRRMLMAVSFFSGDYFAVENVRPGDYYAFAIVGTFNQGQMRDPAYAGPRLAGAPLVRVEQDGTATVALSYTIVP